MRIAALLLGLALAIAATGPVAADDGLTRAIATAYSIPAFKLRGHGIVWMAGWKAHCSIYPLTDAFLADHASELEGSGQGKGTLRFSPDAPLPDPLLEALIRARLSDIEADERQALGR